MNKDFIILSSRLNINIMIINSMVYSITSIEFLIWIWRPNLLSNKVGFECTGAGSPFFGDFSRVSRTDSADDARLNLGVFFFLSLNIIPTMASWKVGGSSVTYFLGWEPEAEEGEGGRTTANNKNNFFLWKKSLNWNVFTLVIISKIIVFPSKR